MAEPKFIPKPGEVDYTNIRYAPTINIIVVYEGRILLAKRSVGRRLYPGYWATIDGFLSDNQSVEEKAKDELDEELGLKPKDIASLTRGQVLLREAPEYGKTWIIVPVLAKVRTEKFILDWEASEARWFAPAELKNLNLLPGSPEVIGQFFPEVLQ